MSHGRPGISIVQNARPAKGRRALAEFLKSEQATIEAADPADLNEYADPDCHDCGGRGCWMDEGDWVPYGSTFVRTPAGWDLCDCVSDLLHELAEEIDRLEARP